MYVCMYFECCERIWNKCMYTCMYVYNLSAASLLHTAYTCDTGVCMCVCMYVVCVYLFMYATVCMCILYVCMYVICMYVRMYILAGLRAGQQVRLTCHDLPAGCRRQPRRSLEAGIPEEAPHQNDSPQYITCACCQIRMHCNNQCSAMCAPNITQRAHI